MAHHASLVKTLPCCIGRTREGCSSTDAEGPRIDRNYVLETATNVPRTITSWLHSISMTKIPNILLMFSLSLSTEFDRVHKLKIEDMPGPITAEEGETEAR